MPNRPVTARALLALAAMALLSGCLAFDQTWEDAAYRDCRQIPNTQDRRACFDRVDAELQKRADDRVRLEESTR